MFRICRSTTILPKSALGCGDKCFLSFPLELIVLGFGAWLYARAVTLMRPWVYWGFVIFLTAMQVYANFGPPPTSQAGMAVMALAFYAVLALAAAAVERIAVASASEN